VNKILPALAGLLLTGSAAACGVPGTSPDEIPTIKPTVITTTGPSVGQPRGLTEQQRKKLPAQQQRPVDVEAQPWDSSTGKIQEFRIVVDEVTRYCLVLVGRDTGGLHCFDSSEVP
jgi:hypothetical protein